MKKKNEITSIDIQITGWELELLIEQLIKEKLGNVDISLIEFTKEKLVNKYIYNHEDNKFSIFVEYTRGK